MNERTNTTGQPQNQRESTYTLLIRSEQKNRNLLEVAIYALLSLGPIIAIWQFIQQPVNLSPAGLEGASCIVFDAAAQKNVCSNELHTLREGRHPEIKG
jgi:hypothetical protein